MFRGRFKLNQMRHQAQTQDGTGNAWSCWDVRSFKLDTSIMSLSFPKPVAQLWFLYVIGLCSYVCLSWSLADASLCKISMVISDAEGAGRAVSFPRSLWEPLCAVLLALWDVATPASRGSYLPEADCRIWYASAKWSEMTISKKICEPNDVSQHHFSLIFYLSLCTLSLSLSLQYADLFQLLICYSKVKYTPHVCVHTFTWEQQVNKPMWLYLT